MGEPAREQASVWWAEARKDRREAQAALERDAYNLSAFLCEQAAQKALKALLRALSRNAWGHELHKLVEAAFERLGDRMPAQMEEIARSLGRHYTGARYPGVLSEQAPSDFYTREMAQEALEQCDQIMNFARERLQKLSPDLDLG